MSTQISDDKITSNVTAHMAVRISGTAWVVTWLPRDRRLTYTEARTAMVMASTVERTIGAVREAQVGQLRVDAVLSAGEAAQMLGHNWVHVNSWAHELGLDGVQAVNLILGPPAWQP